MPGWDAALAVERLNKIVASAAEAVADIPDGAAVMIGGFGVIQGWPASLIRALRARGSRDLTIIYNTPGVGRRRRRSSPRTERSRRDIYRVIVHVPSAAVTRVRDTLSGRRHFVRVRAIRRS